MQEEVKEERPYVIKDSSQPRCALCNEPFAEEWNDDVQDWVYVDAARLPAAIANLPDLQLPAEAIVKVGLLDPGTHKLLLEYKASEAGKQESSKRKREGGDADAPASVRQALGVKAEPGTSVVV